MSIENNDLNDDLQESGRLISDQENEVSIVASSSSRKGKAKEKFEDKQLCKSWLFISIDPIVGNSQNESTKWKRIFNHYQEQIPDTARSTTSLESRWGDISKHISKYCGFLAQCSQYPRSREIEEDVQNRASELYVNELKKPFDLMHCYKILSKFPKWSDPVSAYSQRATRRSNAAAASRPTSNEVAAEEIGEDVDDAFQRPEGRKQAKDRRKQKRRLEEIYEELASCQRLLLENQEKRSKQTEDFIEFEKEKFKIMMEFKRMKYSKEKDNNDIQ